MRELGNSHITVQEKQGLLHTPTPLIYPSNHLGGEAEW